MNLPGFFLRRERGAACAVSEMVVMGADDYPWFVAGPDKARPPVGRCHRRGHVRDNIPAGELFANDLRCQIDR